MKDVISSLTSTLNVHLNMNQTIEINRTSIYFSLEKLDRTCVRDQFNLTEVYFPLHVDPILVRVRIPFERIT